MPIPVKKTLIHFPTRGTESTENHFSNPVHRALLLINISVARTNYFKYLHLTSGLQWLSFLGVAFLHS